jgi:hypothetical protein
MMRAFRSVSKQPYEIVLFFIYFFLSLLKTVKRHKSIRARLLVMRLYFYCGKRCATIDVELCGELQP